jgi:hypothetical protein
MKKMFALLAGTSLMAQPVPVLAYGGAAAIPQSVGGRSGPADVVKDLAKKGLVSLLTAFTNAGTALVTSRVTQTGTAPKNIGWGVGTTAAAVTQTALVTESAPTTAGGRTVGTESVVTTTVTNDTYQVAGTVTAGSSLAITEAGLFDNVTAGNMLIRSDFSAVNVVSGDSIAFTFKLKFAANAA